MRDFIYMVESYAVPAPLADEPPPSGASDAEDTMRADLANLVFRLRAHTENLTGEWASGVEEGMQRAADAIENLLRRHSEGA